MIPIRDHNPSGKLPLATYGLIAICGLVYLYMFLLPMGLLEAFVGRFALIPALVTGGSGWSTFLTSIFLHGSLGHLIGNMLFLHIFGDNLEEKMGKAGYLVFYLVCGLGASLAQILVDPASSIPNLGASGAIAGVMGGYLVLFPRHRIDVLFTFGWSFREVSVPAYTMLFYWFLIQLFSGVGSLGFGSMGGIAFFAHVGGFAVGFLITSFLKKAGLLQKGLFDR